MIGKAKACVGGGALCNYILDYRKGYELDRNLLCGTTPLEISEEFKILQSQNSRALNKTFSIVISPEVEDGKKLSDYELKKITKDFLIRLGIDPKHQQYIAFVHNEKEHKHIHIIANRVKSDGRLISDHHIGKKAQWIGHDIAIERGLISAKGVMIETIKNQAKIIDSSWRTKREIFNRHKDIIGSGKISINEYVGQMKNNGIEINFIYNNKNEIQGYRLLDKKTGLDFKASEINRQMTLPNLIKSGVYFEKEKKFISSIQKTLDRFIVSKIIQMAKKINKESQKEREYDE